MDTILMRLLLCFALACLAVPPAHAHPAAPPGSAGNVRIIKTPVQTIVMQEDRVIAKFNKNGEGSHYTYLNGRLWMAGHTAGGVDTYFYKRGRLSLINSSRGTSQTPLYDERGTLVALASSTGQKLGLAPNAGNVDKVAMKRQSPAGTKAAARSGRADEAQRIRALNYQLIAIEGWAESPQDWDCSLTPEGETVCVGRGPRGGAPYEPYHPEPPPEEVPPAAIGDDGTAGGSEAANPRPRLDLPTLESCEAAALSTYWIMMNTVCPKMMGDRPNCEARAFLIYEDQRASCRATYR